MSEGAQDTEAALVEAMSSAFDGDFEEFADSSFVRRAVRASISGKVKRRSLIRLGFAHGIKTGAFAQGVVHRALLARALGLPVESELDELMAAVRRLREADSHD